MEDWNVLGGKMTPQDFEELMRQLSGLDHTVEPLVYEEPAMCCPKPLAERANPNPQYELYTNQIKAILAAESTRLAPAQISIEFFIDKKEEFNCKANWWGSKFLRVFENPKTDRWLTFHLHYNEGKLHPYDENIDEGIPTYHLPIPQLPPPHPTFPRAQPHLVMPEAVALLNSAGLGQSPGMQPNQIQMNPLYPTADPQIAMGYPTNQVHPIMPGNPLMNNPHQLDAF